MNHLTLGLPSLELPPATPSYGTGSHVPPHPTWSSRPEQKDEWEHYCYSHPSRGSDADRPPSGTTQGPPPRSPVLSGKRGDPTERE